MDRPRSNRITQLGELQVRVLDVLAELGEGTVYDVLDQFPEDQRPRYTTVLTVLRGLEQKGLLAHRTQDRAYVFRPTKAAANIHRQMLRDILDRVFGGSPGHLVAALLDVEAVTPEVLAEMKALIDGKEEEHGR
jgi:predicted transcriptional regulator